MNVRAVKYGRMRGGGGGRGGRSVWEQRANQLRKRRQMESQEVLFGGSPTEDTTDTPTTAYRAPTLSPDASPGHLPESPMSGIMPMPEPPMSIAIPLPEPPDSEPVPLFTLAEERAVNHRPTGGERRHRVARKSRPGPGGAEEGGTARHRRHRHREARAEAKSRESPHEEVSESGSHERKILEEREEKEEKDEKEVKGEFAEVEGGVSGKDEGGALIINLESEEEHLRVCIADIPEPPLCDNFPEYLPPPLLEPPPQMEEGEVGETGQCEPLSLDRPVEPAPEQFADPSELQAAAGVSDSENNQASLNLEEGKESEQGPDSQTSVIIEMSGAQPLLEVTPMTGMVLNILQ
ncbi:unnamed protein product [Oncorhynchus mykiss]|uniref:Uncharacterized protein n=1 Tax=Oncorhynchus mykiss TaxID=8022 RepID=A0A060W826_ONCMY|nr:unnamed protein product [Oncorhynchus mykiss]